MKTSSKKRKTAVKKVAKVSSNKRAKPTAPRRPAKAAKSSKPQRGSAITRAGSDVPGQPQYFWMFAFYCPDGKAPVGWEVAFGGTPHIGPPKEEAEPRDDEVPMSDTVPGPVAVPIEDVSPKFEDPTLFFIVSQGFTTQEDAIKYARGPRPGSYFFDNCTNCVLYKVG